MLCEAVVNNLIYFLVASDGKPARSTVPDVMASPLSPALLLEGLRAFGLSTGGLEGP